MVCTKAYQVYLYLFLLTIFGPIYYGPQVHESCSTARENHKKKKICSTAARSSRVSWLPVVLAPFLGSGSGLGSGVGLGLYTPRALIPPSEVLLRPRIVNNRQPQPEEDTSCVVVRETPGHDAGTAVCMAVTGSTPHDAALADPICPCQVTSPGTICTAGGRHDC